MCLGYHQQRNEILIKDIEKNHSSIFFLLADDIERNIYLERMKFARRLTVIDHMSPLILEFIFHAISFSFTRHITFLFHSNFSYFSS